MYYCVTVKRKNKYRQNVYIQQVDEWLSISRHYSMIIYYCEFLERYIKGSNIHGEFKTTILCVHKLLNINVLADNFVCTVVIYLGIRLKIVVKHLISLIKSVKKLNYTVACILNKINYTFSYYCLLLQR